MADVDIQVERVQSPQIAVDLVPPIEVPVSLGGPIEVKVEVMAQGPAGTDGVDGQGVPTGGVDGQVLAKASAADYDTEWVAAAAGGAVDSVNGQTGVVVLDTDDLAEGVNKYMTSAEKAKLTGIATGATQNATDAQLRDRATHTGSQAISTVTGLQTALDGKASTAQGTLADSAVQPGDLATVATTGDYDDLANTPSIPAQFNPIAGTNVSLTGTYPNITFNASGGGGGAVDSVNGATGVVVLDQDDIADGTTAKQYTATEQTKLAGIATSATANDTDANLKNRANHTGSQAISTVTGLQTALDAKEATITAGTTAQYYRGDKTFQTLDKAAVGLANVDNTSDANKPVSTATQAQLDLKANTASLATVATSGSYNDLLNLPSIFTGESGKQYKIVAGVMRNPGSPNYWGVLDDTIHASCNVDSVSTSSTQITIDFTSIGATKVVSFIATPDETLTKAGFACASSVDLTTAKVQVSRHKGLSDYVQWSSGWTSLNGVFTIDSFASGILTLSHESIGEGTEVQDVSLVGRGGSTVNVSSAGGAITSTNTKIEFRTFGGTLLTTEATTMRAFVTRNGSGLMNPQNITTTAYPASNIWFIGVFEV